MDISEARKRIQRMFQRYDPPRVPLVSRLLREREGQWSELLDELVRQLGPEPSEAEALAGPKPDRERLRLRLFRFYSVYNKEKLFILDDICAEFLNREAEAFAVLTSKYGPEPVEQGGRLTIPQRPPARPRGYAVADEHRRAAVASSHAPNAEVDLDLDAILDNADSQHPGIDLDDPLL